jgi:DNA-binding NtrC family response regulator
VSDLPTVLFVDDEERILRSLRMLFRGRCEIVTTTSGTEALSIVKSRKIDVVVSDQRMPGMTGVDVLRGVRESSPGTMRILLTGYADTQAIAGSINDGEVFRFVEKPWDAAALVETVLKAAQLSRLDAAGAAPQRAQAAPQAARSMLVLDAESEIATPVRDVTPATIDVRRVGSLDAALASLAERPCGVIVSDVRVGGSDVSGVIKELKRANPSTIAIVASRLSDSRHLIELINQGQVFRFLPQPIPKELLRRSIASAFERHEQLRAQPQLQRRHEVEPVVRGASALPSRLLGYWRRIRDNAGTRAT